MNLGKGMLALACKVIVREASTKPYTVAIEGNIGSGKTTFLEHFKKYKNICTLDEPVDIWRNCEGHNLLSLMYKDPKKWAFTFQSFVQLTMLERHLRETTKPIKIIERSLFSARFCFVQKLENDGIIGGPSACVLDEYFKWMVANKDVSLDLIVYLQTSPEVVHKRMQQRSRSEENNVSFEYIKDLHDYHEQWLVKKSIGYQPAPVILINGDLDQDLIYAEFEKYESQILNKMTGTR